MANNDDNTPEVWRAIPRLQNIYEVSNLGQVRRVYPSTHRRYNVPLTPILNSVGYYYVFPYINNVGTAVSIHRLVTEVFLGVCPSGLVVNHRDGNKRNNALTNLEYVTMGENNQHAIDTGLRISARGEGVAGSVLTDEKVRQIRELLKAGGLQQQEIAALFGVCESQITEIKYGRSWKHVI